MSRTLYQPVLPAVVEALYRGIASIPSPDSIIFMSPKERESQELLFDPYLYTVITVLYVKVCSKGSEFSESDMLFSLCQCGGGPHRLLHRAGRHAGHGRV